MYNPYQMTGGFSYSPLTQTPMQPQQQVAKVHGRPGAEAYPMGPNSSVVLLDETAPMVWLKTTDAAGYATLTPYDISPHKTEEQQMEEKYATKEDFNALNARVNKLLEDLGDGKSDS